MRIEPLWGSQAAAAMGAVGIAVAVAGGWALSEVTLDIGGALSPGQGLSPTDCPAARVLGEEFTSGWKRDHATVAEIESLGCALGLG